MFKVQRLYITTNKVFYKHTWVCLIHKSEKEWYFDQGNICQNFQSYDAKKSKPKCTCLKCYRPLGGITHYLVNFAHYPSQPWKFPKLKDIFPCDRVCTYLKCYLLASELFNYWVQFAACVPVPIINATALWNATSLVVNYPNIGRNFLLSADHRVPHYPQFPTTQQMWLQGSDQHACDYCSCCWCEY